MTLETSRRLVSVSGWLSVAFNLFAVMVNLVSHQYATAGASSLVIVVVLVIAWAVQQSEAWHRIKRREVEAQAALAEGFLKKFQEAEVDGSGVVLELREDVGGTKH